MTRSLKINDTEKLKADIIVKLKECAVNAPLEYAPTLSSLILLISAGHMGAAECLIHEICMRTTKDHQSQDLHAAACDIYGMLTRLRTIQTILDMKDPNEDAKVSSAAPEMQVKIDRALFDSIDGRYKGKLTYIRNGNKFVLDSEEVKERLTELWELSTQQSESVALLTKRIICELLVGYRITTTTLSTLTWPVDHNSTSNTVELEVWVDGSGMFKNMCLGYGTSSGSKYVCLKERRNEYIKNGNITVDAWNLDLESIICEIDTAHASEEEINYKLFDDKIGNYTSFLEFSVNANAIGPSRLVCNTVKEERHLRDLDILADIQDEPYDAITKRIISELKIGSKIAETYCPYPVDVKKPVYIGVVVGVNSVLLDIYAKYTLPDGGVVQQDLKGLRTAYTANQEKINDLEAKYISSVKEIQSLNILIDERKQADLQHEANSRFRDRNGPGYILTLKLEGEDWKKNADDKLSEYRSFAKNKQKRPYSKYTELMVSWLSGYIRSYDNGLALSEKSDPVYLSVTIDLSGRFKAMWVQRSKTIVQDIACPKMTATTNSLGIPMSTTFMLPKSHRLITIDLWKHEKHYVFEAYAVESEKPIVDAVANVLRVCSEYMHEEFGITPDDTMSKIIAVVDNADLVHGITVSFIKGDTGEETHPVSIPIRPFTLSQPFIPCAMNFGNTSCNEY